MPERAERGWALVAHVAAYLGFLVPLGNVLGPLLVWMWKKEKMPFVREHGRESVNFQISMSAYALALLFVLFLALQVTSVVLAPEAGGGEIPPVAEPPLAQRVVFWAGIAAFGLFFFVDIALIVTGAMRAWLGLPHRYPFTFRLLK